jgi:hypothetical protein
VTRVGLERHAEIATGLEDRHAGMVSKHRVDADVRHGERHFGDHHVLRHRPGEHDLANAGDALREPEGSGDDLPIRVDEGDERHRSADEACGEPRRPGERRRRGEIEQTGGAQRSQALRIGELAGARDSHQRLADSCVASDAARVDISLRRWWVSRTSRGMHAVKLTLLQVHESMSAGSRPRRRAAWERITS